MIIYFTIKSKVDRAKIRHLDRGQNKKIKLQKKGQKAREYTTREHLRVAELIRACRRGIPLNSGV